MCESEKEERHKLTIGIVSTLSITCTTPPVNITSIVVDILISFSPLMAMTLFPIFESCTTCPFVTFVYVVFVNMLCAYSDVLSPLEGCAPTRTWYWSSAVSMPGSLDAACPVGVERNLVKASLEGARIVMLRALVRLVVRACWFWRRPGWE